MGDFNGDSSLGFDQARRRADEIARLRADEARQADQAQGNFSGDPLPFDQARHRADEVARLRADEAHRRADQAQGEVSSPTDPRQVSMRSQQSPQQNVYTQVPWTPWTPQQHVWYGQFEHQTAYGYPQDARVPYQYSQYYDFYAPGTHAGYHQHQRYESAVGGHNNIPNGSYGGYPQNQQPHYQRPSRWQHVLTPDGYVVRDMQEIVDREPAIPNAVRAIWSRRPDLSSSLENREGGTNVYIRGFRPETTDHLLLAYASRFGTIVNCKAIIDYTNNQCKGFGFVMFENFFACDNAIRAFTWAGYQASFAQKSRNDRLAALADLTSTNIYCTNIPHWWMESNLAEYFYPFPVVSVKISRNENGVSKEVGFAKFANRELAEEAINSFHHEGAKGLDERGVARLSLRFADTREQKLLKAENAQRRDFRAYEYSQSVTLSPDRSSQNTSQQAHRSFSPAPQYSRDIFTPAPNYVHAELSGQTPDTTSPAVGTSVRSDWTPESSMSPSVQAHKHSHPKRPSNLRESISASGETDESSGEGVKEQVVEAVSKVVKGTIGKNENSVRAFSHIVQNTNYDQQYPTPGCIFPRRTQSTRRASEVYDASQSRPLRPLEDSVALGDRFCGGQRVRSLGLRVRSLGSPDI
ncbi:polyadenylate-binding protein [Penicillium taxi]|uniref:polyadenylate-binding protein n=1 Tax=Penicillium taxi TaxID=168475 RepID=UPI0025453DEF|nr:polyadenylate-binding protein [Penicillium taxi]KAJ5894828.1 polyadenylate-binding protein [Penicillium taxi]